MALSPTEPKSAAPAHPSLLPDDYLPLLDELNRIVIASGMPLEGNLFYRHHQQNPGRDNLYNYFYNKRHNFVLACRSRERMLEIGLNGGHSALLALAQGVEFHSVDICWHSYTQPVADFLKNEFKDRFHFYRGDSREVLPALAQHPGLDFDIIHIDGHHGIEYCIQDTVNAFALSRPGAWLLLDDTDMTPIAEFYKELVGVGSVENTAPSGWIPMPYHAIGKLNWLE